MFKKIIPAILFATAFTHLHAQDYLKCGISEAEQKIADDKIVLQQRAALEKFTLEYVRQMKLQPITENGVPVFVIPVVLHIMHDYGSENVTKAQAMDALRIINEDFQKLNFDTIEVASDFVSIVADCQIEFRLAQLDPNGNCTDGITRHATNLTNDADDNVKQIVDWDHTKYLNIWVVGKIAFGAAGYAYYPGAGPQQDGIVILHNYFGSIGTSPNSSYNRHSLSHEIGHYINLRHTWGNSNSPGSWSNCNDDDLVFDTPNTIGVDNFTCDTTQITCTPGVTDNVQNYMDYSSCHNMFTEGQKTRMHAALNNGASGRNNLWTPNNRIETGTNNGFSANACAPVADFSYFKKFSCDGNAITFIDRTWNTNAVYNRVWSFPGGNPSTSTDSIPVVTYAAPGTYDVTLTVTNASGSNVLTRTGMVNIFSAAGNSSAPLVEGFETVTWPNGNWYLENNGGNNWQIISGTSYSGNKSAKLNNFSGNPAGSKSVFVTEGYDLANLTNLSMNFKLSFATRNGSADNLRIYYSLDCGKSWFVRYNKTGANLSTAGDLLNNFTPTNNSQWRQENVSIAALNGKNNVRFKFEFNSQGGNNIYIDDINISGTTVGVNELNAAEIDFNASPNPAHDAMQIQFNLNSDAEVEMQLFNMMGSCVKTIASKKMNAGNQQFKIENNFAPGIYMLQLTVNGKTTTQKIVFE